MSIKPSQSISAFTNPALSVFDIAPERKIAIGQLDALVLLMRVLGIKHLSPSEPPIQTAGTNRSTTALLDYVT